MLATPIFNGQGLGNQLACYVTTRCLALDKGYEFGTVYPERFKGSFLKVDLGKKIKADFPVEGQPPTKLPEGMTYYLEAGDERRGYDPNILNIKDNTIIHGCLQGEDYFKHRKEEIKEWLNVHDNPLPEDICIINFRGGEYVEVKDFFLPQSYWDMAVRKMQDLVGFKRFMVVTDDVITAQHFFPFFPIHHDMEQDWRMINSAKYLILSNSSFAFFPAWLGKAEIVIAPKYWARYNKEYWSMEQNKVKGWKYLDKKGNLNEY